MAKTSYWYDSIGGSNIISDLPAQAIPSSKKNDKWKKSTMDSLERIAIKQFEENKRFVDYFRMSSGKVSYTELSALIPQLRELETLMDDFQVPSTIRHYDLLGIIVNYLQSVMVENKDKFNPVNIDEISSNERQRKQSELMQKYFLEQWNKELAIRMINKGIDVNKNNFKSEEEKQAYIQQIEQTKEALTPIEIKNYLERDWKTQAVEWSEHVIEADNERFRIYELDRDNIYNYLHTGRCFQHYYMKYDTYSVENWNPINTFFSQTIDSKYPQYGEYVGRLHFYTPSDFINKKGHHFSEKETAKILNNSDTQNDSVGAYNLESSMRGGFERTQIVPHEGYHDHEFLLGLQDQLGIPLATRTVYKKDGTQETFSDYIPSQKTNYSTSVNRFAQYLREDLNLRKDMIMVTEAYWRSYQRVAYITWLTKEGSMQSDIVTDELIPEFIEEYGIKELRNVTLEQLRKKAEPNTIVWGYRPQIWYGEKANLSTTSLGEDSYYNIKPLEYQIKGDSNIFDVQIPVAGIIDNNPADKIIPYQNLFNFVKNQEYNLQEKEIGAFFVFDMGFLPSDIREHGDTETTLQNMINVVKRTSLLGTDTSRDNMQGKTNALFNQFQTYDLSLSPQIQAKQVQAEYYKNKAYEQFGITPQSLGEAVKYQTAEGVNQTTTATKSQTDYLYEAFSNFKSRSLEIHLAVAQYCQKEGRDISVEYTKSDLSRVFLKFTDLDFPLRRFGIMAVSNSKKRKELELMKSYLLNQNTMQTDTLELASLVSSDNVVALIEIARLERLRKEKLEAIQRQHEMDMLDKQLQLEREKEIFTWQLNEKTNDADRLNELEKERIAAIGRAADNESTLGGLDYISTQADLAIKREQANFQNDIDTKELDLKIEEAKQKYKDLEDKRLLERDKLALENKRLDNERYIAQINKN